MNTKVFKVVKNCLFAWMFLATASYSYAEIKLESPIGMEEMYGQIFGDSFDIAACDEVEFISEDEVMIKGKQFNRKNLLKTAITKFIMNYFVTFPMAKFAGISQEQVVNIGNKGTNQLAINVQKLFPKFQNIGGLKDHAHNFGINLAKVFKNRLFNDPTAQKQLKSNFKQLLQTLGEIHPNITINPAHNRIKKFMILCSNIFGDAVTKSIDFPADEVMQNKDDDCDDCHTGLYCVVPFAICTVVSIF